MKLKFIDALRGVGVLGVMTVHTGHYGANNFPAGLNFLVQNGARGVQLFFMVSAFTLFLSFEKRTQSELNPIRNFFIRRFFRIAPMYYLGICYFLFQNGFGAGYWPKNEKLNCIGSIISNSLFVHGLNPNWISSLVPGGWSISVEMTFYAIIPFLVRRINSLNKSILFTFVSLILSGILKLLFLKFPMISNDKLWNDFLFLYFPSQLPIFGLGIISFFVIVHGETKVSLSNYLMFFFLFISHVIWHWIPFHFLFSLGFFGLILTLSFKEFNIIVNRLTIFLGTISYSSYLVHFAVLYWLSAYNFIGVENFFMRLGCVIFITSIISWGFLKMIERPFQKFGKTIIRKLNN